MLVSIPYRQAQDGDYLVVHTLMGDVSIPYRQAQNPVRTCLYPICRVVLIPYRQAQNDEKILIAGKVIYLVSIPYRQAQNKKKQLGIWIKILCFNSLQVGSKHASGYTSIPWKPSFNSLQVGSKHLGVRIYAVGISAFQFLIGRLKTILANIGKEKIKLRFNSLQVGSKLSKQEV